jgi:hypothetical protein
MNEVKHTPEEVKAAFDAVRKAYAADLRLRDAAPEMLEALEKVDGHLSILMGDIHGSAKVDPRWEGMEDVVRGWRNELKAVLARAKGLTP